MAFDRGSMTFRICNLLQPLPDDLLERFNRDSAGSLESVKDEPVWGWVSGRHLLDTRIDDETAILGGYVHLGLRQAQRKVPTSLLRAECRMAELALEAEKQSRVNRKERKQIKEEVTERLLPKMPPQLSGVPFVIDRNDSKLYLGATSEKQLDVFLGMFYETVGFEPVPQTPEIVAVDELNVDPDSLPPLSFSPDVPDSDAPGTVGQNFLTWLWYFQEECGGELPPSQLGRFSIMVDGPLVFVNEGPGAYESALRKGTPTVSAEAKAALLVGKKLKRAKVIMAREREEEWSATVDADSFVFRSLKVPEGEALDPGSIFEERINNLYIFQKIFFALFQRFVKEMSDPDTAAKLQQDVKKWTDQRVGR